MQPDELVRAVWNRISERDWSGLGRLMSPDVRVEWPATGEVFIGAENFVAIQSEYPEGWSIDVLTVIGDGDRVVSEVEVPHEEFGLYRAASFWTVRGDVISSVTEYWINVGGEQPPAWRGRYSVPR